MRYVPLPELIVVFVSANAVVFEPARAIRVGQCIGRSDVTHPSRPANGCVLARK